MVGRLSGFFSSRQSSAAQQDAGVETITDYMARYLVPFSPERQIRIARQILSRSSLGQKRLIEPEIVDGVLKYRSSYFDPEASISGRRLFDNIEDAINYFSSLNITESYRITKENVPEVYRGYASVLRSIASKSGEDLEINIAIHKTMAQGEEASEALQQFYKTQAEKGYSLLFPTDDGGVAFNFIKKEGATQRLLTTDEAIDLMYKADVSLMTPAEVMSALRGGNEKMSKLIQKLDKRIRGVLSPREVSASDDMLKYFLKEGQDLKDVTLMIDRVFETLGYVFDIDTAKGLGKAAEDARDIARLVDLDETKFLVRDTLEEIIQSMPSGKISAGITAESIERTIKSAMIDALNSGKIKPSEGVFGSKILSDFLPEGTSEEVKKIVGTLLDELEKADDGSSLINAAYSRAISKGIQQEIDELTEAEKRATSRLEKEDILLKKIEKQRTINQLDPSKGLSQVTVRGNVAMIGDKTFSLKSAGQIVEFAERYGAYALITPIAGLKKETRISGLVDIFNISGTGESKALPYVDPMLTAFHSQIFGSEESINLSKMQIERATKDLREVMASGRLSEDSAVYKSLIAAINDSADDVPEYQQFSRLAHKALAEKIIEIHRSGANINDHPRLFNMILDFSQKEFYKLKKGIPLPVLGDVYRFALNSESTATGGKQGGRTFLSNKAMEIFVDDDTGPISVKTSKVRFSNHNLLMSQRDVIRFHHALGGFDLDDKGLPVLGTYMSNGKNRLAMAMVRQPTGFGEAIGFLRFADVESYQELFSHNQYFMNTLEEMIESESGLGTEYSRLKDILQGNFSEDELTAMDNDTALMDDLEDTIIKVRDKLYNGKARVFNRGYFESLGVLGQGENAVRQFGAAPLAQLAGVDPDFAMLGFRKMQAQVMSMQLESDVFSALSDIIPTEERAQLKNIVDQINSMKLQVEELQGGASVSAELYQPGGEQKLAQLEQLEEQLQKQSHQFYERLTSANLNTEAVTKRMNAFYMKATKDALVKNQNILGVHVNRATVVASGLNQFQKQLGTNTEVVEEITKRGLMFGFPASEISVDMTQTFTRGRLMLSMDVEMATSNPYHAMQMFQKMYGNKFNLEEHGSKAMGQYGKLMGFLQGVDGNEFFIDRAFMDFNKMSKADLINFTENYVLGRKELMESKLSSSMSEEYKRSIQEEISSIEALLEGEEPSKNKLIKELTSKGLIKQGELSEQIELARDAEKMREAMRKSNAQNMQQMKDGLESKTTEMSKRMAKIAMDKNEETIREILDINKEIRDAQGKVVDSKNLIDGVDTTEEMIEYGKIKLEVLKRQLADDLLQQMSDARTAGVTGYQMMASLELEALSKNMSQFLFEQMPDTTFTQSDEFANFFYRLATAADFKRNYEKSVANVDLQRLVSGFFDSLTDPKLKDIMISDIIQGKDVDLRGFDFEGIDVEAIKQALKNSADTEDVNARALASAIRARAAYENSIRDSKIAEFLNGTVQADKVIDDYSKVDEQTPRIVAEALQDAARNNENTYRPTKFTPISMDYLREQFSKPGVRKAALATGLAIAGSFIYQSSKDRTSDDMAGPPLLPGGSPYESGYPQNSAIPPDLGNPGYSSGMNYKVSLYGSRQEAERFREAVAGLTNGNVTSTMYNRIPDVGVDPYREIASSF